MHIARLLALLSIVALPGCAALRAASDPTELQRTWNGGELWLHRTIDGVDVTAIGYRLDVGLGILSAIPAGTVLPTVLYMHGCSGFGPSARSDAAMLSDAGYLVLMPNSFARTYKPRSCDPQSARGGFHREVLAWRHAEVAYALQQTRKLPYVDQRNIFLMGFSEGGIAAATFPGGGFAARVVTGWTCHSAWPEYRGINAPPSEPVLSVVASRDPWFQRPELSGECGSFMNGRPESRSVIVEADVHHVNSRPDVQEEILRFLVTHQR